MPNERPNGYPSPLNLDTASRAPETRSEHPFMKAGFEVGDQISYREAPYDETKIMTVGLLQANNTLFLFSPADPATRIYMSPHPDQCTIYRYSSIERARSAYVEALPNIQSRKELLDILDAMEQSGVQPNDPVLNIGSTWSKVRDAIKIAEIDPHAATPDSSERIRCFTRQNDLRNTLIRILQTESARTDILNSFLESFRQLSIGGCIRINQDIYEKTGMDSFRKQEALETRSTVALTLYTAKQIEARMHRAQLTHIEIFSSIHLTSSEQHSLTEKISTEFKVLIPELYPLQKNRVGDTSQKAQSVGVNDVLKYLPQSEIRQGTVGDCYLLAGINSLKKNRPDLYLYILSKSIRKDAVTGAWQVRFQGMDLEKVQPGREHSVTEWITVTNEDLMQWKTMGARSADIPDIILERAYASYISRAKHGRSGMSLIGDRRSRIAMDGGLGHRALHDLIGPRMAKKYMIAQYETEDGKRSLVQNENNELATRFLQNIFAHDPKRYIVTANTIYTPERRVLTTVDGYPIRARHAFSVIAIDDTGVRLEDPHDTSEPILMNMKLFLNTFSQISYVEISEPNTA